MPNWSENDIFSIKYPPYRIKLPAVFLECLCPKGKNSKTFLCGRFEQFQKIEKKFGKL